MGKQLSAEILQDHLCSMLFCTLTVLILKLFACENIAAHTSCSSLLKLCHWIHLILQLKPTLACILRKNVPSTFKDPVPCCRKSDPHWNLSLLWLIIDDIFAWESKKKRDTLSIDLTFLPTFFNYWYNGSTEQRLFHNMYKFKAGNRESLNLHYIPSPWKLNSMLNSWRTCVYWQFKVMHLFHEYCNAVNIQEVVEIVQVLKWLKEF